MVDKSLEELQKEQNKLRRQRGWSSPTAPLDPDGALNFKGFYPLREEIKKWYTLPLEGESQDKSAKEQFKAALRLFLEGEWGRD